jgi:hypothetical protein
LNVESGEWRKRSESAISNRPSSSFFVVSKQLICAVDTVQRIVFAILALHDIASSVIFAMYLSEKWKL